MKRSKCRVRSGCALISSRARVRVSMEPCDQLRAETGMWLIAATRLRAETTRAAPCSPTKERGSQEGPGEEPGASPFRASAPGLLDAFRIDCIVRAAYTSAWRSKLGLR